MNQRNFLINKAKKVPIVTPTFNIKAIIYPELSFSSSLIRSFETKTIVSVIVYPLVKANTAKFMIINQSL